jgi:peptide/nickel transport system substrate-binding protein
LDLLRAVRAAWICTACLTVLQCSDKSGGPKPPETASGGTLVSTFRTEPVSFNRIVSAKAAEEVLSLLTNATLVRVNRVTGALEPRLAREWTSSPDGLTWTVKLREGVTFSDGVPFTANDVLFSIQAVYDKSVESPLADVLTIGGKPLTVRALDDHTLTVVFPAPFGPGFSLFNDLPILPSHKLADSLKAGTFAKAWPVTTAPSELAGLGPFVLQEYKAGERMVFVRNSRFWLKDEQGRALPYLDRIEMQIVPEPNAELLRLQSGTVDLITGEVRPEDLATLKPLEASGALTLVTAGVDISPDAFWINLTPGAAPAKSRPWLQKAELRQAINEAVDRQEIANAVYLGIAEPIYGPVTPGAKSWFLADLPKPAHDLQRAKSLLESIGLTDRTGDGMVDDAAGKPVSLSVLTQKGTLRERTIVVLQEQLRRIGLAINIVATDPNTIFDHYMAHDFDAIYFYAPSNSTDPARNTDYWQSTGQFHFWNPMQKAPATTWEATIDDLMQKQSTTMDPAARKQIFSEVQRIFSSQLPALYFVATQKIIAMSSRVHGATPSVLAPPILWNAERLSVADSKFTKR